MPDCNLQLAQEDLEDQDVPKERKIKGCVGRYYYMGPSFFCLFTRMWYEHSGYITNTHFEVGYIQGIQVNRWGRRDPGGRLDQENPRGQTMLDRCKWFPLPLTQ